jgi:kynurenine formamidase
MVIISQFTGHDEKHVADGYEFSSPVMSLNMGDHSGTHVDAPVHFDERPGAKSIAELPLEDFSPRRSVSTAAGAAA